MFPITKSDLNLSGSMQEYLNIWTKDTRYQVLQALSRNANISWHEVLRTIQPVVASVAGLAMMPLGASCRRLWMQLARRVSRPLGEARPAGHERPLHRQQRPRGRAAWRRHPRAGEVLAAVRLGGPWGREQHVATASATAAVMGRQFL